jgi:hypothetical protein
MITTSDYIYKESLREFNATKCSCDNYKRSYTLSLPTINKICGINVCCDVLISKIKITNGVNEYFISILIDNSKILMNNSMEFYNMYNHREKLQKFSSKKINEFLLKFKNDILPHLKLDNVFGKFELVNKNGKKIITRENIGMDVFGLEYSNSNECVVCYGQTFTISACEHHLCIDCWNKLKTNDCPMCRENLTMKDERDDDDDDDDLIDANETDSDIESLSNYDMSYHNGRIYATRRINENDKDDETVNKDDENDKDDESDL